MPLARKLRVCFCLLLGASWSLGCFGLAARADDAALPPLPAYTLPPAPDPAASAPAQEESAARELGRSEPGAGDPWGVWLNADTLVWFLKNGPLPVPLLATGNPADRPPGALGQPGTHILLGGSGIDYGTFPGIRWSMGKWWGPDQSWALEWGGFWLDTQTFHFQASGDTAGNPPLYVPVFRAELGREGSFIISDPVKVLTGSVLFDSQSRLWGMEMNGRYKLRQEKTWDVHLLAGFRYLELDESLRFAAFLRDPLLDINSNLYDLVSTKNQFYGMQVGGQAHYRWGRLSADVTGKVAFGYTREFVNIAGAITETGTGVPHPGVFPGGLFTQPTNIGRTSDSDFALVPELAFRVGFEPVQRLQIFVGYTILYWSSVVRPGNQIDRSINQTQQAGGVLFGPARPAPLFQRGDFYAHGLNVGLAFRY